MRKFLLYLFYFSLPIVVVCLLDSYVLPPIFFAQRVWDGLSTTNQKVQPFYPNYTIEMDEIGDLGFHTSKAIKKHVIWKTDDLGFRNDSIIHNPDILLIGDSFVAGTSLTQDKTLTAILDTLTKNKYRIYNIAPATFSSFMSLVNHKIIKKPKMIILFSVERFMYLKADTSENILLSKELEKQNHYEKFDETVDRLVKFTSRQWFSSLFKKRTGIGFPSAVNSKMLFFEGSKSIKRDLDIYKGSQLALSRYNEKCKQMGIQFLFVPMPNKESVYWELVPYKKQPNLLFRIDSALKKQNIAVINTLALYNEERRKGHWLYHFDDTHWNENGVTAVANEIVKFIDNPIEINGNGTIKISKVKVDTKK